MNCFESRRRIAAAPLQLEASTRAHLRSCAACGAFASRMAAADEKIEEELRIPVPEGLADRVLFRVRRDEGRGLSRWLRGIGNGPRAFDAGSAQAQSARPAAGRRVAIAALALLPAAVGSWFLLRRGDDDLALDVIGHVMHDEQGELAAHPEGDPAALPGVLAASAVNLPDDFRAVRYIGRCGPPNHSGEHLVLLTPLGKVSLVLMPGHVLAGRVVAARDGAVAVLMPARVGCLAVVALDEQTASRVATRLA